MTTTSHERTLSGLIEVVAPHATAIRRELHRFPELMFKESRTCAKVCAELTELGITHVQGLAGGTGVVAYLPSTHANPLTQPTVGLRADMDALPIRENTGLPYASENPGVMHACGHDGHTAILLGAARALANTDDRPNNVVLVFQPAEEGGAGGEKMCAEGAIDGSLKDKGILTAVDVMFGLHGWSELELGKVSTRVGPLLAATDEFTVTITGNGGHAAYPHKCVDPIVAAAQITTALQTIVSRETAPVDSAVVTVGAILAGDANNVIPETAEMRGTIRSLTPERRKAAELSFRRITTGIAEALGCTADIQWHVGYPVTFNHEGATERFRTIARAAIGEDRVIDEPHPTMGGEDFSFYGLHVPACFFLLGLRPAHMPQYPRVHTAKFDFNDDALPLGIEMMVRLALDASASA